MKSIFVITFISLFSFASFSADGVSFSNSKDGLSIIGNLLASSKTPSDVKILLKAIVDGQSYDERVSIMTVTHRFSAGKLNYVITVGTDDTTDEDDGWSSLIEIQADYESDNSEKFYNLKQVNLVLIAG
jgi:hypothetical protein